MDKSGGIILTNNLKFFSLIILAVLFISLINLTSAQSYVNQNFDGNSLKLSFPGITIGEKCKNFICFSPIENVYLSPKTKAKQQDSAPSDNSQQQNNQNSQSNSKNLASTKCQISDIDQSKINEYNSILNSGKAINIKTRSKYLGIIASIYSSYKCSNGEACDSSGFCPGETIQADNAPPVQGGVGGAAAVVYTCGNSPSNSPNAQCAGTCPPTQECKSGSVPLPPASEPIKRGGPGKKLAQPPQTLVFPCSCVDKPVVPGDNPVPAGDTETTNGGKTAEPKDGSKPADTPIGEPGGSSNSNTITSCGIKIKSLCILDLASDCPEDGVCQGCICWWGRDTIPPSKKGGNNGGTDSGGTGGQSGGASAVSPPGVGEPGGDCLSDEAIGELSKRYGGDPTEDVLINACSEVICKDGQLCGSNGAKTCKCPTKTKITPTPTTPVTPPIINNPLADTDKEDEGEAPAPTQPAEPPKPTSIAVDTNVHTDEECKAKGGQCEPCKSTDIVTFIPGTCTPGRSADGAKLIKACVKCTPKKDETKPPVPVTPADNPIGGVNVGDKKDNPPAPTPTQPVEPTKPTNTAVDSTPACRDDCESCPADMYKIGEVTQECKRKDGTLTRCWVCAYNPPAPTPTQPIGPDPTIWGTSGAMGYNGFGCGDTYTVVDGSDAENQCKNSGGTKMSSQPNNGQTNYCVNPKDEKCINYGCDPLTCKCRNAPATPTPVTPSDGSNPPGGVAQGPDTGTDEGGDEEEGGGTSLGGLISSCAGKVGDALLSCVCTLGEVAEYCLDWGLSSLPEFIYNQCGDGGSCMVSCEEEGASCFLSANDYLLYLLSLDETPPAVKSAIKAGISTVAEGSGVPFPVKTGVCCKPKGDSEGTGPSTGGEAPGGPSTPQSCGWHPKETWTGDNQGESTTDLGTYVCGGACPTNYECKTTAGNAECGCIKIEETGTGTGADEPSDGSGVNVADTSPCPNACGDIQCNSGEQKRETSTMCADNSWPTPNDYCWECIPNYGPGVDPNNPPINNWNAVTFKSGGGCYERYGTQGGNEISVCNVDHSDCSGDEYCDSVSCSCKKTTTINQQQQQINDINSLLNQLFEPRTPQETGVISTNFGGLEFENDFDIPIIQDGDFFSGLFTPQNNNYLSGLEEENIGSSGLGVTFGGGIGMNNEQLPNNNQQRESQNQGFWESLFTPRF